MPIETTEKLKIKCDNPVCPGNDLDPEDRVGWLFVTSEWYGDPVTQHVFCSAECTAAAAASADAEFGLKEAERASVTS